MKPRVPEEWLAELMEAERLLWARNRKSTENIKTPFRNFTEGGAWSVGKGREISAGCAHTGAAEIPTEQRGSSLFASTVKEPSDIILKLFPFLP